MNEILILETLGSLFPPLDNPKQAKKMIDEVVCPLIYLFA
jgi:hypothetical protein